MPYTLDDLKVMITLPDGTQREVAEYEVPQVNASLAARVIDLESQLAALQGGAAEAVEAIQSALKLLEDGSYGAAMECLSIYRSTHLVPNGGWCNGCSPENCSGCGFGKQQSAQPALSGL